MRHSQKNYSLPKNKVTQVFTALILMNFFLHKVALFLHMQNWLVQFQEAPLDQSWDNLSTKKIITVSV